MTLFFGAGSTGGAANKGLVDMRVNMPRQLSVEREHQLAREQLERQGGL